VFGDVSEATLSPFIVVIIPPAPPIRRLRAARPHHPLLTAHDPP